MSVRADRLRAVMFDWAGTTVDYGSRAPAAVFVETLSRIGLDITEAEAREPMGRAKRDHIASILAIPRVSQAWIDRFGQPPGPADVDRLYQDFLPLQREVLIRHCDVIAGVPEAVAECRRRGMKIASSTGYTRELVDIVAREASRGGYVPDAILCADDATRGRPAPWMIFRAAEQLDVYPMEAWVTVDDTTVGIDAGRNAGTWTVAISKTGNGLGLSRDEVEALDPTELRRRVDDVTARFHEAGADFVIEGVADLPPILDRIDGRLRDGGRPGSGPA